MIIYDKTTLPTGKYERMITMKCKIMTWDEFREMCREDAQSWYYNGYASDELTPDEVAQRTLDYLKKMGG